jgi:hypothetical protein
MPEHQGNFREIDIMLMLKKTFSGYFVLLFFESSAVVDYGAVVPLAQHNFQSVGAQVPGIQQAAFDYIRGFQKNVADYVGPRNLAFCSSTDRVYLNNIYPVGAGANHWKGGQLTEVCDLVAGNLGFNYRGISDKLNRINVLFPAVLNEVNALADDEHKGDQRVPSGGNYDLGQVFTFNESFAEFMETIGAIAKIATPGTPAPTTLNKITVFIDNIYQRIMDSVMWYVNGLVPRPLPIPQVNSQNIFANIGNFWNFAHTEYEIIFDATGGMQNQLPAMHIISYLDMCDPVEDNTHQYHASFWGCERFLANVVSNRVRNPNDNVIHFISFVRYHNSNTKNRLANWQTNSLRLFLY